MMATRQIREARRLLNWLPATVADRAGLPIGVVRRAEQTGLCEVSDLIRIWTALEEAGIQFSNGGCAIVSLRADR